MKFNKKLVFLLLLMPAIGMATTTAAVPNMPSFPSLKAGLNISRANQCTRIFRACQNPKKSPLPDDICVQRKVKANPSCDQLQELADILETSPALLDATAAANDFAIIRKNYPADGQFQNFIISPTGQIVDTRIDPRLYSSLLKVQYPNKDLVISNIDPVQSKGAENKRMTFTTTVKVSDGCLACSVLGYATSRFVFKKNGMLQTIRLMSFSKQENQQIAH